MLINGDKMKKISIQVISLIIVLATMLSMLSCKTKKDETNTTVTEAQTKAQTSEAVAIADIPTDKEEIIKMLNSALDYVDVYCYAYTKQVKCDVADVNVGTLSSVSNSTDAFKSIFGGIDATTNYDYKVSKENFSNNFIKSGFTANESTDAIAQQDGEFIVLTVNLKSENNPKDGEGILYRLGGDYLNAEDVKKNLADFSSSAKSISISASDISITAKISIEDSSLKELDVKYTEGYTLSGVTLVKLEGASVTGNASTVISYTDIG